MCTLHIQTVALLQSAFNHTPVSWQLVDMAKGNTEVRWLSEIS